MSASASVIVGQAQGVNVPNSAITGSGSLATVTVLRNGKQTQQAGRRRPARQQPHADHQRAERRRTAGHHDDPAAADLGTRRPRRTGRRPRRQPGSGRLAVPAPLARRRRSGFGGGGARRRRANQLGGGGTGRALAGGGARAPGRIATSERRPTSVIDVRDVHKTYRVGDISVPALRGVSLRIERGEYVAIMGHSGSGKSTLMNILGCLDTPTSGAYRLNGLDVRDVDEDALSDVRNRFIGFVFQSFNLIPRTRAVANVELPMSYAGVPHAKRRERALTALAAVGLGDRVNHEPSELSGGQQQRVAIARALVTNPALILDEPTGNLDTASGEEVLGIFERLSEEGRTIVLITHEDDVAAHAQRVIRISDGAVIADERPTGLGGSHDRDDSRGLRGIDRQQAALGADDPRADDRRRLGDRADRRRHRLLGRRPEADRRARQQRAAGPEHPVARRGCAVRRPAAPRSRSQMSQRSRTVTRHRTSRASRRWSTPTASP